jgi:pyruvate,water dikinase
VHARGFLSVLAESALDPGFEPSSASIYSMKNYFLVSSRFCTLQSRFGYHFCTVETLAGDVDAENFAAFRFKGGAADADRRLMRVRLIADILEENNFRVQVIRDSLAARMEGLPLEHMLRALQVLGYLAMHTRQLDMVMSSPEAVQHYRDKIATELQEVLGSHTTF